MRRLMRLIGDKCMAMQTLAMLASTSPEARAYAMCYMRRAAPILRRYHNPRPRKGLPC